MAPPPAAPRPPAPRAGPSHRSSHRRPWPAPARARSRGLPWLALPGNARPPTAPEKGCCSCMSPGLRGAGDPCVGPRPPSLAAWPSAAGCAQATGHRGCRQRLLVGQRGSGRVNEGRRVGGEQASRTLRGRGIASDTGGERGAEAVGGTRTRGTGWLDPAFRERRDGALWDSGDRGPATRPATSGTPRAPPASGDG